MRQSSYPGSHDQNRTIPSKHQRTSMQKQPSLLSKSHLGTVTQRGYAIQNQMRSQHWQETNPVNPVGGQQRNFGNIVSGDNGRILRERQKMLGALPPSLRDGIISGGAEGIPFNSGTDITAGLLALYYHYYYKVNCKPYQETKTIFGYIIKTTQGGKIGPLGGMPLPPFMDKITYKIYGTSDIRGLGAPSVVPSIQDVSIQPNLQGVYTNDQTAILDMDTNIKLLGENGSGAWKMVVSNNPVPKLLIPYYEKAELVFGPDKKQWHAFYIKLSLWRWNFKPGGTFCPPVSSSWHVAALDIYPDKQKRLNQPPFEEG